MKTADNYPVNNRQFVWIAERDFDSKKYYAKNVLAIDAKKSKVSFYFDRANCNKIIDTLNQVL